MTAPRLLLAALLLPLAAAGGEGVVLTQTIEDLRRGVSTAQTLSVEPHRAIVETTQDGRHIRLVHLADEGILRTIDEDRKIYRESAVKDLEKAAKQMAEQQEAIRKQMRERLALLEPEQRALAEKALAQADTVRPAEPLGYTPNGLADQIDGRPCTWFEGRRGTAVVERACVAPWESLGITERDLAALDPLAERLLLAGVSLGKSGFPGVALELTSYQDGVPIRRLTTDAVERRQIPDAEYAVPAGYQLRQVLGGF